MQENELKILTLGPEGTFSHQAAAGVQSLLQREGIQSEIVFSSTINNLFKLLSIDYDLVVAPLENSEAGSIGSTVDQFAKHRELSLEIVLELDQIVEHYLAGFGPLCKISTVYAHPQAQLQSEEFLERYLPNVVIEHTTSNSKSASNLARTKSDEYAAIVPIIGSTIYSLPIIQPKIQNSDNNLTRFIVVANKEHTKSLFSKYIKSKMSIIVDPETNYPGLLHEILGVFAKKSINLSRIESRPSKRKLGDYVFHIDIEITEGEIDIKDSLETLKSKFSVLNLGTYCNLCEVVE